MSTTTLTATQPRVVTTQGTDTNTNTNDTVPKAENDPAFQALARGDRNGRLKLRGIPTFTDPMAKRQWIREHMAGAFRFFGKQGYGEGVSGHISVRGVSPILNTHYLT